MPLRLERRLGRVVVAEEGSRGSLAHLCTESKASPPPGPCPTNPAIPSASVPSHTWHGVDVRGMLVA